MAIIRQRRALAIQRVYSQAAFVYLICGFIVFGTSYLPGMRPEGVQPPTTTPERLAPLLFLAIATLVIWRSYRKLSILLLLMTLYRAAVNLLNGLGTHFEISAEQPVPTGSNLTDPGALQAFFDAEIATETPFYESADLANRAAISGSDIASSLQLPQSIAESLGELAIQPSSVAYLNAALLLLTALFIWRAVRHPKA